MSPESEKAVHELAEHHVLAVKEVALGSRDEKLWVGAVRGKL